MSIDVVGIESATEQIQKVAAIYKEHLRNGEVKFERLSSEEWGRA